jgi:hypothetical protein
VHGPAAIQSSQQFTENRRPCGPATDDCDVSHVKFLRYGDTLPGGPSM